MSQAEREFMNHIDELVLAASPQTLKKLAEIDRKTQLSGTSFYDVYSSLPDEDKKQILVSGQFSKKK